MNTSLTSRLARTAVAATVATGIFSAVLAAELQPVAPPGALTKPLTVDWPRYSGDYTGQRFSRLTQLDRNNVKHLSLAWVSRISSETRSALIGGEGKGDFPVGGASVKGHRWPRRPRAVALLLEDQGQHAYR
jgi:glucose dehydrogenase